MRSIEVCAGAGGQALGLEQAGFKHVVLIEIDKSACDTIRLNRPKWNIVEGDIRKFSATTYHGIDLLAGGIPCPPFSVAGKQLGHEDERNLFPEIIRLIDECMPKAVMIENVRGLLDSKFDWYRADVSNKIEKLGYTCHWCLLNSSDFGVPQLRPRTIMVAFKQDYGKYFQWPKATASDSPTVGDVLVEEMGSNGWMEAANWAKKANKIAPTLVGGSKKHGGADLGPTRSKIAWSKLGVDGKGLADCAPNVDFTGIPRLTVQMAALIQGFPKDWIFAGKKTPAYRQVGNAFPPPVAKAVGEKIKLAIETYEAIYSTELRKVEEDETQALRLAR